MIAVPLGIGAARLPGGVRARHAAQPSLIANIRNLAGVPSIVYGILGLVVFVQALRAYGPGAGLSYLSGGLTLAILVMPFVIIITMEALRAVPRSIREAPTGSAPPGGRWSGATSCRTRRRDVHRQRSWRWPGRSARPRRSSSSGGDRLPSPGVGDPIESLQGKYTALPTISLHWARQPGEDWGALTAAAIVVLLA